MVKKKPVKKAKKPIRTGNSSPLEIGNLFLDRDIEIVYVVVDLPNKKGYARICPLLHPSTILDSANQRRYKGRFFNPETETLRNISALDTTDYFGWRYIEKDLKVYTI